MTRLYLIAAAEAEGDLYRIAEGWYDAALTARGQRQAAALAQRFSKIPVDAVYVSDLYSGAETADAVFRSSGLPTFRCRELREMGLGLWEERSWGTIQMEEPRQYRNFRQSLPHWYVDEAETPGQVQARMLDAVRRIACAHEGGTAVLISHRCAIRLLQAALDQEPLECVSLPPAMENAAVSVIRAEGGALCLDIRNDASHLKSTADSEYPQITPQFNTDLSFYLLRWIEYGELMASAVECVWPETGDPRPFDRDILLNDASMLTTLVGYADQQPVGFLQMGAEPGWITLLCTHPGCRNVGLGTQLIGQAILSARQKGGRFLRIALAKGNPHRLFFLKHGFLPVGELADGREVLEKDISLSDTFLSE